MKVIIIINISNLNIVMFQWNITIVKTICYFDFI